MKATTAAPRAMKLGNTVELPRELLAQAAVKFYADTCRARGRQMPTDVDLLNRCHVTFLDADDREVEVDSVAITWDEG